MSSSKRLALLAAFGGALGCRPEPPDVDYSSHEDLRRRAAGPEFLLGPNPFDPSRPRLGLGLFYEGLASSTVPVDGASNFYFIFDTAGDGSGIFTYSQELASDRVEGTFSDRIVHAGQGFLGGGIVWYSARDVSRYEALHVSLKSSDGAFSTLAINLQSGRDRPVEGPDPVTQVRVLASTYGFRTDGEWHSLRIPLADLEGLGFEPSRCRSPFILEAGGGRSGETLLVDDLYLE